MTPRWVFEYVFPKLMSLCGMQLTDPVTAIVLSVTVVLTFGEIIPQAVCSRYGDCFLRSPKLSGTLSVAQ